MWMHLHWEAWEKQVKQAKEIGDVRHHHQQAVSWSVVLKTHQILMENWAFSLLRAQFISSFFAEHPGSHSFASSLLQIYLLELLKYSCRKPLVNPELGGNYASHQCWLRESSKPYNLLPADCAWSGLWSQQHLQHLLKFRGSISKVGFKEILSGVCTVVKDKPFNHSRLSKSGPLWGGLAQIPAVYAVRNWCCTGCRLPGCCWILKKSPSIWGSLLFLHWCGG